MTTEDAPKAATAPPAPDRTIYILYIPGGGMNGIMPALMLDRLEKLTGCSTSDLFQVFDGVSTGSILAAGMTLEDPARPGKAQLSGHDGFELFCHHGPAFFPDIPGRFSKMWIANALNTLLDYIDPQIADELAIDEIGETCDELLKKTPWEYHERVRRLRELATTHWLTQKKRNEALHICDELDDISDEIDQLTDKVNELIYWRILCTRISIGFRKAAIGACNFVLNNYAHDYLFDPEVQIGTYKKFMGERRLSDSLRSIYISAYDIQSGSPIVFFNRKADFFSRDPATPSITSKGNHKLVDVIMSSTANPFAVPPYTTEDGVVCSDKAPVHTPLHCVQDVMAHKPPDAKVKLVVLGTGKYFTKNQKVDNKTVRDRYIKYGVPGMMIKGKEIAELEHYVMGMMRDTVKMQLGEENIIELSPRLAPHNMTELKKFPSKNVLNASKDNIEKIVHRSMDFLVEEDDAIRSLAQELVDNLYNLGQIPDDKYAAACTNIGLKTGTDEIERKRKDMTDIIDRNVPPPPGPLKRLFSTLSGYMPRPRPRGPAPRL